MTGFVDQVEAARSTRAVAAIETAFSGTAIFASSTGNHYIITLDHEEMMRLFETQAILDNEIDFAGSEGWRARESTSSSSIKGIVRGVTE